MASFLISSLQKFNRRELSEMLKSWDIVRKIVKVNKIWTFHSNLDWLKKEKNFLVYFKCSYFILFRFEFSLKSFSKNHGTFLRIHLFFLFSTTRFFVKKVNVGKGNLERFSLDLEIMRQLNKTTTSPSPCSKWYANAASQHYISSEEKKLIG